MARISSEEKESATLIPLDRLYNPEDDAEAAFNDFRETFQSGDDPGQVRAWELSIDDRGNVGTRQMQTRLGSWPIDAYKFDELCEMLVAQYMSPEKPVMAVRLCGTKKDETGFKFNKIVLLKRPIKKESSREGSESTGSLLKMMQEMNERNMAMFARMQAPPPEPKDPMVEIQKMMAFSQSMNAPMMTMLQSLLPALAGRAQPVAGGDPFAGLSGMMDFAERIADMRGTGGGDSDTGLAGIIKAVMPAVVPALQALPAIAAMAPKQAPAPRLVAPAAPTARPANPISIPTAAPPPAPSGPANLTDIPTGDQDMLAQLKPQIDQLVTMAEQKSDPTGAADLIFEQVFLDPRLPEEIFGRLAEFVENPQFVNYVTIMAPLAKPHVAWFEAFKAQIIKRLDEEATGVDDPTSLAPGL